MQRVIQNDVALEREYNDEGKQQSSNGNVLKLGDKALFKVIESTISDDDVSRDRPADQRNDNEQNHRENQCIPGDRHTAYAEKERHNRSEGNEYNEIVRRYLHHRVGGVPLCQMAPDKHHGGAGSSAQQNRTGKITTREVFRNQRLKNHKEKQPGVPNMVKGLISQLVTQVTNKPFGFLPTFFML